jgi:hypothetical protein
MKSAIRLRGTEGTTMMEYVLILIVIGLTVLFFAHHLGVTLRARYGAAKATTDMTKVAPDRHIEVDDQGLTGTAKSVQN